MKTNSKGDKDDFHLLVRASVHHDLLKSKISVNHQGSIRE
jgi:hypothetical protein